MRGYAHNTILSLQGSPTVAADSLHARGPNGNDGSELKRLREDLGEAIGRELSAADMAKLCGLPAEGADTVRRWERPVRREAFREQTRNEERRRLA